MKRVKAGLGKDGIEEERLDRKEAGLEARTSDGFIVFGYDGHEDPERRPERIPPAPDRPGIAPQGPGIGLDSKGRTAFRLRNRFDANRHIASSQRRVVPSE